MRGANRILTMISIFVLATEKGFTQSVPSGFFIERAASAAVFETPVGIAFAPDGRIFVAEKRGRVYVIQNGAKLATPFINLETEVFDNADRGLLGIALDPHFDASRHVYLLYGVDPDGDGVDDETDAFARLTRYTANAANSNVADLSSRRVLIGATWSEGIPICHDSHGSGGLRFAGDGTLLVSAGDAASSPARDAGGQDPGCFGPGKFSSDQDVGAFRAQYLGSMSGKILRIDPATGLGLSSNPYFTGSAADIQSKVWAYGVRNPFRFVIRPNGSIIPADGKPGSIYIGDVGWGQYEEISVTKSAGGENFGWPCYEGPRLVSDYRNLSPAHSGCSTMGSPENPARHTLPLVHWHHTDPAKSQPTGITGKTAIAGEFYTGAKYPSKYSGAFFYGDYTAGWIKVLKVDQNDKFQSVENFASGIAGFVDMQAHPVSGDLYYVDIAAGQVYQIRYGSATENQRPVAVASADPRWGYAPLTVKFKGSDSRDPDGDPLTYSWDFGNGGTSNQADPTHTYAANAAYTATLTVRDNRGAASTQSVSIIVGSTPPKATILSPENGSSSFPDQTIMLSASAVDADDPQANLGFRWEVILHHNDHLHPSTAVIEGKTGSFVLNQSPGPGEFFFLEFELRVTDSSGLEDTTRSYVVIKVAGEVDITASATPIALITNPSGSGNRDINVIKDDFFPPLNSSNPLQQYDTNTGSGSRSTDWIGFEFSQNKSFAKLIFQEGMHFSDGGWFESIKVQVRSSGAWKDVLYFNTVPPPYPGNNEINYETFTLLFAAASGDAIRISGIPGGNHHFISVGELRVVETPVSLKVAAPNGGENWAVGSSQMITWSSQGSVANVRLEFSANNGASWTTISSSTSNDGSFTWTVPDAVSSNCLVRVSDAADGNPVDVSDAVFAIVAASPTPSILSFLPTDDAHVKSSSPALSFGLKPTIRQLKTSTETINTYLKFVVNGLSGPVQSAKLRLYVEDASSDGGSAFTVLNHYAGTTTPWTESGLNWNNAPAISGATLSSAGAVSVGTWVELQVTAAISGNGTYSFGLKNNSINIVYYTSKEGSNKPELLIQVGSGSPPAPSISSFTPSSGAVGTAVTITGSNFTGATSVKFNGTPAASFTVDSSTKLRTTVPAGATTGRISVTTADGTALSANGFTVTTAGSSTLTFLPVADSYVKLSAPTNNYGLLDPLRLRETSTNAINTYLKFDVVGVSGPVQSAKLRLFCTDGGNDGGSVYLVSNDYVGTTPPWTELGLTWNNAPAIAGTALRSAGAVIAGTWVELDITAALIGDGTYSFGMKTSSADIVYFTSREGTNAPQLVIQTASLSAARTNPEPAAEALATPQEYRLAQNYPNPFNPETRIAYDLPEAVHVRLAIYDVLGHEVATVVNSVMPAGYHSIVWDSQNRHGQRVSAGIYFYHLRAGNFSASRKMVLLQ